MKIFKDEWRLRWDAKKTEMIHARDCTGTGRIRNPGNTFYLNLVKDVVDCLNAKLVDGIPLAQKAMIMYGLVPNTDGVWSTAQLTPELRKIVEENPDNFKTQKRLLPSKHQ